jgi:glycosyltransferase involved in cell wall biosynthesis
MPLAEPRLSLCMIVRNEAENLPRSLGPVKDRFDEIIVVDTGSTDNTRELAQDMGVRVISIEWPNHFALARNRSIEAATGDWIMWLDADNYIAPEDVDRLRDRLDHQGRKVLWCTEMVIPSGEKLIQKRVFPRNKKVFFAGRVHEQLVHPRHFASVMTDVVILHWGYRDKLAARAKGERNLRLLKQMLADHPGDMYIQYQTGKTLLNLRRFEEALAHLDRATKTEFGRVNNPGIYLHAHILKAQVLERLGDQDDAEQELIGLLKKAPEYGPGHYMLGRIIYAKGDHRAAAETFQQYLKLGAVDPVAGLNPAHMGCMAAFLLGKCLETLGQPGKAGEAYQASARYEPDNPEPKLALAKLALDNGEKTKARNLIELCLEISPKNRRAIEMLKEAGGHV